MTFSTKVSFVPRDNGEKSVSFNEIDYGLVPYGKGFLEMKDNILNNFKFLNFREINNYYFDYVTVLSIEEFIDFHKLHHKQSFISQELNQFISVKLPVVRFNWVVIEVYEWESGLD
jgi:hypothetical protein